MSTGKAKITHNGIEINLRFGIPANRMLFETVEKEAADVMIGEVLNEIGTGVLLHCGYVNACLISGETPVLKRGFFIEYVEEATINPDKRDEMKVAVEAYIESTYTKHYAEQVGAVIENLSEEKKRLIGMQSKNFALEPSVKPTNSTTEQQSGNTTSAPKRTTKGNRKKIGRT